MGLFITNLHICLIHYYLFFFTNLNFWCPPQVLGALRTLRVGSDGPASGFGILCLSESNLVTTEDQCKAGHTPDKREKGQHLGRSYLRACSVFFMMGGNGWRCVQRQGFEPYGKL